MKFSDIFTSAYLFNPLPPRESRLLIPFLILFSVLILFSIIIRFIPLKIEKMASRYSNAFLIPSIIGYLYIFGRYERLPWLGSRAFLAVALAVLIIWTLINTIWAIRYLPKYKKVQETEDRYLRYLPKPKKKK